MKNHILSIILLVLNASCIYILLTTFISFRYQLLLKIDSNNRTFTLSKDQVESIPSFPNIGVTTLPIKSQIAKYYMYNGEYPKAKELLKLGSSVNPHIFYSDFLLGRFFLDAKNIDSAYYHSKKALYGWPKNIDHYKLFNKILEIKKDTTQILDTYDFIKSVFKPNQDHQQAFIDSYSNAKLGYLIFKYPDEKSVVRDSLYGTWQQMFEFETGEVKYLDTKISFSKSTYTSGDTNYDYSITRDTLNILFKSNKKLISRIPIYYSDSLKTLILKNIKMTTFEDSSDYQDKFFKKIN